MPISVLLVEDHTIFRAGVRSLVDAEPGFVVVGEAADGRSAISQVQALKPDVVVMDIGLPDIHGVEATRRVKQKFPETNVLALSIHGEKQIIEDMLRAGASGYLLKESAPEELLDGIRAVAGGERFLSAAIKDVLISQYMQSGGNGGPAGEEPEPGMYAAGAILDTKLHQPRVPSQSVQRPHLWPVLNQGLKRPLTLVCAPAGYGKSTLVSQWLERCDVPSAWISLDDRDSNLRDFFTYFVKAIQGRFPEALPLSALLLNAGELPPLHVLATTLVNELAQIHDHYVLVLDDFQRVGEPAIHEVLRDLLRHPPQTLHLVLITRMDPALDLAQMRAYRQVGEIRAQALRFTEEETEDFFGRALGVPVAAEIAAEMTKRTEGWITGLHLATLSARNSAELADGSTSLIGEQQTLDYLVAEALARQPRDVQAWLLRTSILNRFCAPLCEALCLPAGVEEDGRLHGVEFVNWLDERNLFVISLDHRDYWFRYHHLFQNLLQGLLDNALNPDEIALLHKRASDWFLSQGMLDDAFDYALKAGDVEAAVAIVEDHRHVEHDADRWYVVERWLDLLPADVKTQCPGLLLAQAWTDYHRFHLDRVPALVEQAGELLENGVADPILLGDLHYFRGNLQYWQGEGESSVRNLEASLAQISGRQRQVEYNAQLSLALSRCMIGQKDVAIEAVNDRIQSSGIVAGQYMTYLIGALAIVRLICGELPQARVQAERLHAEAVRRQLTNNMAWGAYLHGATFLQAFDLERALPLFVAATERRYSMMRGGAIDALAATALTQQLMLREADAVASIERLLEFARDTDDPHALAVAQSCRARVALLRGDVDSAMQWASSASDITVPSTFFLWVEIPAVTLARVYIAGGTEENLEKACGSLNAIRRQCEEDHFMGQTIEIVVLQALALERQGLTNEALGAAENALTLAMPGGWIRPFVEAGEPMAQLLAQLRSRPLSHALETHIDKIVYCHPTRVKQSRRPGFVEVVTERELHVLRLLASDLSAVEIAAQLELTVATVRSHTRSLYGKLDVHSRHEAVLQARELELIS